MEEADELAQNRDRRTRGAAAWAALLAEPDSHSARLRDLAAKIRANLDEGDADQRDLTVEEFEIIAWAILDAARVPAMENALDDLRDEDRRAHKAFRKGTGKPKKKFYEAARIKGWVAPKGEQTSSVYPEELEFMYSVLVGPNGTVDIGDRFALGQDDEGHHLFDTPMSPENAIEALALIFGAKSPDACRAELHRRREFWKGSEWAEFGPDLSSLPHRYETFKKP
ncbi:MAG: hypothetical protein GY937_18300 [bacterium]|nr:hypothetical protein [bacterium]